MAFSQYYGCTMQQIREIFQLSLRHDDLFSGISPNSSGNYDELQRRLNQSVLRIKSVAADNEATRRGLLVTPVISEACFLYGLGIFLEKELVVPPDRSPDVPHQLNGSCDYALSMDIFDFIAPVIAVIEAKPRELSKGIGQCVAELVATLALFERQHKVYGIVTDGEIWEFMLLSGKVLTLDQQNYHVHHAADIIDRIGYIVRQFQTVADV